MAESEAIAKVQNRYGGVFTPYDFHFPINRIARDTIKFFEFDVGIILSQFKDYDIKGVNLNYFFSKRNTFNARCTTSGGIDFIVVHYACIPIFYTIIGRMLSFDKLALISEQPPEFVGSIFAENSIVSEKLFGNFKPEEIPNFSEAESRPQWIIEGITIQALRFFFHHELAHLWNGHLDRLRRSQGAQEFTENYSINDSQKLYQNLSLEIDADARAVYWLTGIVGTSISSDSGKKFYYRYVGNLPVKCEIYKVILAIYVLIRIKCSFMNNSGDYMRHRIVWAMGYAFRHISRNTNLDYDLCRRMLKDIMIRGEKAFCAAQKCEDIGIFKSDFLKNSSEEYLRIMSQWNDLVLDLEKYKRGMTLPKFTGPNDYSKSSYVMLADLLSVSDPLSLDDLMAHTAPSWMQELSNDIDWVFKGRGKVISDKISEIGISMYLEMLDLTKIILNSRNFDEVIKPWKDFVELFSSCFDLILDSFNLMGEKHIGDDLKCISIVDNILSYVYNCRGINPSLYLKIQSINCSVPLSINISMETYENIRGFKISGIPHKTCRNIALSVGNVARSAEICCFFIGCILSYSTVE